MTDPITRLNAALDGRYRVEREIGEGGMAVVYLAEDLRHERNVALKVLKPELAAVVGAERFLAEIKTTANLQHPHILPLHDSGEADGFLFFVTPYIEGDTLRDKIDREKQLGIEEALDITKKVASALDHAHKHGVVHRDIKPGNILLSAEGEPTVADFGIALAVAQAGGGRVTETGLSVGHPPLHESETDDRGSGCRSAGGCLCSGLCALRDAHGRAALSGKHCAGGPREDPHGPDTCSDEVRVSHPPPTSMPRYGRRLEKLPADRFGSAQEFSDALRRSKLPAWGRGRGGYGGRPRSMDSTSDGNHRESLLWPWCSGFGLSSAPEPPQRVSRQVVSTEGWAGLEAHIGRQAAIAPDGSSMILPVGSVETGFQLALKMTGSTEITSIPGTEGGSDAVYSPDGQWIAYVIGTELFKRSLVGGSPLRLAEDTQSSDEAVAALDWLDDGTILYEQIAVGWRPTWRGHSR